jgi:hypothetical protein
MGQDLQPQDLTWEKLGLGRLGPKPGLGVLRPFLQFPRLRSRHGVGQNATPQPNLLHERDCPSHQATNCLYTKLVLPVYKSGCHTFF